MDEWQEKRLTGRELHALFDRLFTRGFAGTDVLAEIAPEGWERSPLLACFHPSVEQLFKEQVTIHRNLEEWRQLGRRRKGTAAVEPRPEPTLEDVRREYEPSPVNEKEEVTEVVGLCLWDIFSDNHDVISADGRLSDIGSFRGASAQSPSSRRRSVVPMSSGSRRNFARRMRVRARRRWTDHRLRVRAYRQMYGREPRGWPPA